MKTLIPVLVILLSSLTGKFALAHFGEPTVSVPLTTLYIPSGFDSDDNVQIVGEGYFRNSCFSPAPPDIKVDHYSKTILVNARAYVYQGACAQVTGPNVLLPFSVEFNLGNLMPGVYQIFQGPLNEYMGQVKIATAYRSNTNGYFYAPISEVIVQQVGSMTEIRLSGFMLGSCLRLGPVETSVENNVIIVEPFAFVQPGEDCLRGQFPFSTTLRLYLPRGRYLLHIRSENGDAINRMIDVVDVY